MYRIALSIVLLCVVCGFWYTRFDELAYSMWQNPNVIELGDATSFLEHSIKPNSYVKITGILGNQAATLKGLRTGSLRYGTFQVRHLLGSKLYIEYDQERYHQSFNPFTRVEISGRLVSFGPGSDLEKVRDFFARHYKRPIADNAMLVVVDEKPRSQWRYLLCFCLSIMLVTLSFYLAIMSLKNKKS
jgi:hypothetical protein